MILLNRWGRETLRFRFVVCFVNRHFPSAVLPLLVPVAVLADLLDVWVDVLDVWVAPPLLEPDTNAAMEGPGKEYLPFNPSNIPGT